MRKFLIIGLCVLGAVAITIAVLEVNERVFSKEKQYELNYHVLNYHLHESYMVDTTNIRQKLRIADGTPFTFFWQLKRLGDSKEHLMKEFGLEVSTDIDNIDLAGEDKFLMITIGRELESVVYQFRGKPFKPRTVAGAHIVFAEEYHEQMMYVYIMDKILLESSFIGGNRFFIMKGTEVEFWGYTFYDINEFEPWDGERTQGDGSFVLNKITEDGKF